MTITGSGSATWISFPSTGRGCRKQRGKAGHMAVGNKDTPDMSSKTISINRAPVLTLWASVVAERLSFDEDESLSLGKALAGLTAQTKGRRLGLYKPHEEGAKEAREKERGEEFWIELCGRPLPERNTEGLENWLTSRGSRYCCSVTFSGTPSNFSRRLPNPRPHSRSKCTKVAGT